MIIALAQLNPLVGDLNGNRRLLEQAVAAARAGGASLLVTPELGISGYPPRDLLKRAGFVQACEEQVRQLALLTDDQFGILIGHPGQHPCDPRALANCVSLLTGGTVAQTRQKILLPNYDVFDEQRYFQQGTNVAPMPFQGRRLGVHICEDAWWGEPETFYHCSQDGQRDPLRLLADQQCDVYINLSASPFQAGKIERRQHLIQRHVEQLRKPFLFVNQVGGNDDLVFDGSSFALNGDAQLILQAAAFSPDLQFVNIDEVSPVLSERRLPREHQLLQATTLGLQDYMKKSGFTDCVLGLSGGIDSALAACIAARAVGPEHVHGILMPSRYSSQHSLDDARTLAENLGMNWTIVPIEKAHATCSALPELASDLSSPGGSLADQNLQARIRGMIVMTRSNRHNWLALATGNKSELAVGYCTLYGDMCGGFAVLNDLYKGDVYDLSRFVNVESGREIIPENVLKKAPSAELAPNQVDQDTLPPYPVLDGILRGLIDRDCAPEELFDEYPAETVLWVLRRLDRNEFKRRQAAPGVKLTPRAFGTGRRMPMAARTHEGNDFTNP